MIFAGILFLIGLLLSAFFSGSETGLYRVSRTRLVLDGLSGSRGAQRTIWLLNHPEIFVATALVGNNLANYVTSLSIVLGAASLFGSGSGAELLGPMLMTPICFCVGRIIAQILVLSFTLLVGHANAPFLLGRDGLVRAPFVIAGIAGPGCCSGSPDKRLSNCV